MNKRTHGARQMKGGVPTLLALVNVGVILLARPETGMLALLVILAVGLVGLDVARLLILRQDR